MPDSISFGTRLRLARERRLLTLTDLARATKISASLFESLEAGTCDRWPVGVYSRAHVRTYAELVGLDADEVVEEFSTLFPHLAWSEQDQAPDVMSALRPGYAIAGPARPPVAPLRLVFEQSPVPLWRVWLTRVAWLLHRLANGGAPPGAPATSHIQAPLAEPDDAPIVPLAGLQVDQ